MGGLVLERVWESHHIVCPPQLFVELKIPRACLPNTLVELLSTGQLLQLWVFLETESQAQDDLEARGPSMIRRCPTLPHCQWVPPMGYYSWL